MEPTPTPPGQLAPFPTMVFRGELRPSQRDVVELARAKLAAGRERRLHVAAPPGAGKTVLGLYLWAQVVRRPALVLAPNTAIQAQWAASAHLFDHPQEIPNLLSTDPARPAYLTLLTYQALTVPGRHHAGLDTLTRDISELPTSTLDFRF